MFSTTEGLVSRLSTNIGSSSLYSGPATAGFSQVADGTGTRRSHGTAGGIGSNAARPGGSTSWPLSRGKNAGEGAGANTLMSPTI